MPDNNNSEQQVQQIPPADLDKAVSLKGMMAHVQAVFQRFYTEIFTTGLSAKYEKPSGGIPGTDLANSVQTSLGKADAAYQKPSGGIPGTDLASSVQDTLGKVQNTLDIELLPADYVFKPGDTLVMNGVLYKCTAQTENTPFTLLAQDGKILYVSVNGQKCYMTSGTTLNAGWQKVADIDDKYYVEKRLAGKADKATTLAGYGIIDAYTKTQIDALTRHTRLTDFDLNVLKQAVAEQNLEKFGLRVGDEKTINGHTYIIAGLNPMKGTDSYTCTTDHVGLIVVPHATTKWNASGSTSTGGGSRGPGYMNSDLHYYLKNTLLPLVETDLGAANLLGHSKRLSSSVSDGKASTNTWEADCKICALSDVQVLGSVVMGNVYDVGEANQQLEVFQHFKHSEILADGWIWLRNVDDVGYAACVVSQGFAYHDGVAANHYVAALVLFH